MDRNQYLKYCILLFPVVGFMLSVAGDSPRFRHFDFQPRAMGELGHAALLETETGNFDENLRSPNRLDSIWNESNDSDALGVFSSNFGVADSQLAELVRSEAESAAGDQLGVELRIPTKPVGPTTGQRAKRELSASKRTAGESSQIAKLLIEDFSMAKIQFNRNDNLSASENFGLGSIDAIGENLGAIKFARFEDALRD